MVSLYVGDLWATLMRSEIDFRGERLKPVEQWSKLHHRFANNNSPLSERLEIGLGHGGIHYPIAGRVTAEVFQQFNSHFGPVTFLFDLYGSLSSIVVSFNGMLFNPESIDHVVEIPFISAEDLIILRPDDIEDFWIYIMFRRTQDLEQEDIQQASDRYHRTFVSAIGTVYVSLNPSGSLESIEIL